MDKFIKTGFIIRNGKESEILVLNNCNKIYDLDYFLSTFKDENEFRDFAKYIVNDNITFDVDKSDIYCFALSGNNYVFTDLLFNKGEDFLNNIDRVRRGEEPNYYSTLNDSFQRYKRNEKYKLLFNSKYNNMYDSFKNEVKKSYDKGSKNVSIRKPDWLKRRYPNYREVVFLRDLYYENKNSKYEKLELLCEKRKLIQRQREYVNEYLVDKINRINKEISESKPGYRKLDLFLIEPDEDLKDFYDSRSDKKVIDETILDRYKLRRLSNKEKEDRKEYIVNTLLNNSVFPISSIEYDEDTDKYSLNIDKLIPDCDDLSKSFLDNKLTSKLLGKLKCAKADKINYDRADKDGYVGSDIFLLKLDMENSRDDVYSHFDKLIESHNMKSFQKVYEFCLLLNSVNKDKNIYREEVYDPIELEKARTKAIEDLSKLKEGNKGGKTR